MSMPQEPTADPYGLNAGYGMPQGQQSLPAGTQAIVDQTTSGAMPGPVPGMVDPETGEPIAPEYDTEAQEREGIHEEEINIRKAAEYDRAFKLLIDAGVGVRNIQAAAAYYKAESGIPDEDEIDGTELIIAVANGLPGRGETDPKTGMPKTKPLISDKNLTEVLDRINAPTKEEGSEELKELKPRKRPEYNASVAERTEDTVEFLKYFKNTFREDDEVLGAVTNVLEETGNYQLIEELGLEKFQKNPTPEGALTVEAPEPTGYQRWQPGDPVTGRAREAARYGGSAGGPPPDQVKIQKNLSPEAIMKALSKPEESGFGSEVGERARDYGRRADEFAEGTIERTEADATGFGGMIRGGIDKVLDKADTEMDTRARKTAFRRERERAGSPHFLPSEEAAEGSTIGGPPDLFDNDVSPFPRDQVRTEKQIAGYGIDEEGAFKEGIDRVRRDYRAGETVTGTPDETSRYRSRKKPSGKEYTKDRDLELLEKLGGENAVLENAWTDAFLREYRSGRYAASIDNPLRDPKGVITPIQKKNHSPDLDRKIGDEKFYENGKIRNPWNQYMNDDIAISKADSQALATRGLTPNSPLYQRVLSDLHYAATQEAKEMLYSGTENLSWEMAGEAQVKYYTDTEKPPVPRTPRSEQRSSFGKERPGLFGNITRSLRGGVNSYLNEINQTTEQLDAAYGTMQDAGSMWSKLDAEDRKEIQFGAYLNNMYGDQVGFFMKDPAEGGGLDPFQLMDGDVNDATAYAYWNQLVQEAALTAARGTPLTPNELVRKSIDESKSQLESYWGATSTDLAKVINVSLTDPNAVKHDARLAAQTLLGRNPTEDDFKNLVGMIHSRERDSQIQAARASAEGEANRKREVSAWQRAQFELLDDQFDDPSTFPSFNDPKSPATFGNIRPTTSDRIANLNKLATPDPEGMLPLQRNTPRSQPTQPGAQSNVPTSATPFQSGDTGGGTTITESTEFNASAAIEEYFRRNFGQEIDAHTMEGFFNNIGNLLRSPIQGT